jgi:hypothetical protein
MGTPVNGNGIFPKTGNARFLQETHDGALDTGLGLHGVDVAAEQERDDARRTEPTDRSWRSPLSDYGLTYQMGAATQLTYLRHRGRRCFAMHTLRRHERKRYEMSGVLPMITPP